MTDHTAKKSPAVMRAAKIILAIVMVVGVSVVLGYFALVDRAGRVDRPSDVPECGARLVNLDALGPVSYRISAARPQCFVRGSVDRSTLDGLITNSDLVVHSTNPESLTLVQKETSFPDFHMVYHFKTSKFEIVMVF